MGFSNSPIIQHKEMRHHERRYDDTVEESSVARRVERPGTRGRATNHPPAVEAELINSLESLSEGPVRASGAGVGEGVGRQGGGESLAVDMNGPDVDVPESFGANAVVAEMVENAGDLA